MALTQPPPSGITASQDRRKVAMHMQEHLLLEQLERATKFREGRLLLVVHLSKLQQQHQRDHYIRIAIETFEDQIKALEGQLFVLADNDLVFFGKNVNVLQLEKAMERLMVLFSDDPLVVEERAGEDEKLSSWYRLEVDYDEILQNVRDRVQRVDRRRRRQDMPADMAATARRGEPLTPTQLAQLEAALGTADISNVLRRQTACSVIEGMPLQPLFDEIFVSINDLRMAVAPSIDLRGNRWLFHHFTHTLDRRVLAHLVREGMGKQDRPYSLNLNIATLLSPEFQRFDQTVTPQLRTRLVIELHKIDVFSDMGAFIFARDWLRDRGYRLCIDGLTHLTLPYVNRARLGFDLIKLFWTPDSICNLRPEQYDGIHQLIIESGQSRVILCRCETAEAVKIGQSLGIVMFQGQYVEDRLRAQATP